MGPKAQAVHERKVYLCKHNALYGSSKLIESALRSMEMAPSVTYDGKCAIQRLWRDLRILQEELYNFRVEEDGRVATIIHNDRYAKREEPAIPTKERH